MRNLIDALVLFLRGLVARLRFPAPIKGAPAMARPSEQHFTPTPPPFRPPGVPPVPDLPPKPPLMPNETGKKTAQAIIGVFETGSAEADYGACAILRDGAGLSYGKHQATDLGGSLVEIMLAYASRPDSLYGTSVSEYISWISDHGSTREDPNHISPMAAALMDLLSDAGDHDAVMREVQDQIFDDRYWQPAEVQCVDMGLVLPLSWSVIYDTCIHSGPHKVDEMRVLFAEVPPVRGGGEREWVRAYVRARREWLANHKNGRVRITTARMDSFLSLMDASNWQLSTPLTVLGIEIE